MNEGSDSSERDEFRESSPVVSPLSDEDDVIAIVEAAYLSESHLLIYGWILGFAHRVESAFIRIGETVVDLAACCNRIDRPDISKRFLGAGEDKHGFLALVDLQQSVAEVNELLLKVTLFSGRSQGSRWPVQRLEHSLEALPDSIVASLEDFLPQLPAMECMRLRNLLALKTNCKGDSPNEAFRSFECEFDFCGVLDERILFAYGRYYDPGDQLKAAQLGVGIEVLDLPDIWTQIPRIDATLCTDQNLQRTAEEPSGFFVVEPISSEDAGASDVTVVITKQGSDSVYQTLPIMRDDCEARTRLAAILGKMAPETAIVLIERLFAVAGRFHGTESFRSLLEARLVRAKNDLLASRHSARRPNPAKCIKKLIDLRLAERLQEAEVTANAAIKRFPHSLEVWHEYAMVAHAGEDLPEAARRWEKVVSIFPDALLALRFCTSALREAGRIREAEILAENALGRFPDEPDLWNEYALAARDRGDLVEAARRWESMRLQIPNEPVGYAHGIATLREVGRFDEADSLCELALTLFPEDPAFWNERAMIAAGRREVKIAARRWQEMLARFPDFPEAYTRTAMILRDIGQVDEAEAVIRAGASFFPDNADIAIQHAWSLYIRLDWQKEHSGCWDDVRIRFPDLPEGYAMSCNALMRMGRLDEAEALSEHAIQIFPSDFGVLRSRADLATRRSDWPEAVRRWKELQALYPEADGVAAGIDILRMTIQLNCVEHGDQDVHSACLLDSLIEGVKPRVSLDSAFLTGVDTKAMLEDPDLFSRFESLGGTCEFGIVQRVGGAHALGLLRWCSINTMQLIAALESRFEGVGSLEQTFLSVNESGEYILNDRRFFEKHTFTFVDDKQTDATKSLRRMCHWLVLLKDRLIRDLESAEKIFVYKPAIDAQFEVGDAIEIWRAIRVYAPNTVLCVRLMDALHPAGTVERIADGLLVGYIDRNPVSMDRDGVSYECWSSVCRSAAKYAGFHPS